MRYFTKLLLPSLAILLSSSLLAPTAVAEMVIFQFKGRTQATIDGVFYGDEEFKISVSIDDSAVDQFPFQSGRGAFSGATTTLTIPSVGIYDAVSTNVTGIMQEDFGNPSFRLVDPSNFYGSAALGLAWRTSGVIPDVNSINELTAPVPTPGRFEGGLQWKFLLGPDVTFNTVHEVAVGSYTVATAGVPEPTSFTMFAMGMLAVSFKRRRR